MTPSTQISSCCKGFSTHLIGCKLCIKAAKDLDPSSLGRIVLRHLRTGRWWIILHPKLSFCGLHWVPILRIFLVFLDFVSRFVVNGKTSWLVIFATLTAFRKYNMAQMRDGWHFTLSAPRLLWDRVLVSAWAQARWRPAATTLARLAPECETQWQCPNSNKTNSG